MSQLPSLARTSKFEVWNATETNKLTRSHNVDETIILNIKIIRKILPSEVLNVAINNYFIELEGVDDADTSSSDSKMSTDIYDVSRISISNGSDVNFYPVEVCRAALFTRLASLLHITSKLRVKVFQLLIDLLNGGVVPALSVSGDVGRDTLGAVLGVSGYHCYTSKGLQPAKAALTSIGIRSFTLSSMEANFFESEACLYTGVGSIIISAIGNLTSTIDCVSAVSCEAVGSSADSFDPLLWEGNRPHRGQMNSATNLKVLLEGSRRSQQRKMMPIEASLAFSQLPQSTGPARDYILAASKAIDIELNSSAVAKTEDGTILTSFSSDEPALAIQSLSASVSTLLQASYARIAVLEMIAASTATGTATTAVTDSVASLSLADEVVTNTDVVVRAWSLISMMSKNLLAEASLSLAIIESEKTSSAVTVGNYDVDDNKIDDDNDDDIEAPSTATTAGNKSNGNNKPIPNSKKVAIDLTSADLTPAQRAKIEAKQKAKADKKAAKQSKKIDKSTGEKTKSIPLGAGSEQVRLLLSSLLHNSDNTDTAKNDKKKHFSLLDISNAGLGQKCLYLLESFVSGGKRRPKIAKGTRDYGPEQMRVREQAFNVIRRIFKRHGAVEIDTPVFELKEILTGKYGEDSKLIYDLSDQGGELLSLRYDLTVPFARYLAMNSTGNIKRFQIAKVYRRDQPQLARGRYREFYQCDFDIAGTFAPMVADAEAITVGTEILSELPVGSFLIKLNHRKLLDAVFEIAGVPTDKFRPICSAVDKLDKATWEEVKHEMIYEKGLDESVADKIGTFVLQSGEPHMMLKQLTDSNIFGNHIAANEALQELELLFIYLESMGSLQYISFDLSLARGLDYYTGVIYEAVLTAGTSQVGSIAAGGRYDNLVCMFSQSSTQTPCVGISIGIERIFAIVEKMAKEMNLLQSPTVEVYVASIGDKMTAHRMKITKLLWASNIPAESSHQDSPKFKRQLDEVLERSIPFMVVLGQEELEKGTVKIKDMIKHDEVEVDINDMVSFLLSRQCRSVPVNDLTFMNALRI